MIQLEAVLQAVGNVGFPIAVAAYLLVRIEGKLEALAASIVRLAEAVAVSGSREKNWRRLRRAAAKNRRLC